MSKQLRKVILELVNRVVSPELRVKDHSADAWRARRELENFRLQGETLLELPVPFVSILRGVSAAIKECDARPAPSPEAKLDTVKNVHYALINGDIHNAIVEYVKLLHSGMLPGILEQQLAEVAMEHWVMEHSAPESMRSVDPELDTYAAEAYDDHLQVRIRQANGMFPILGPAAEFMVAMTRELLDGEAEGKTGWDDPEVLSETELKSRIRRAVVNKGDYVSAANYCMMLHHREQKYQAMAYAVAADSMRDGGDMEVPL